VTDTETLGSAGAGAPLPPSSGGAGRSRGGRALRTGLSLVAHGYALGVLLLFWYVLARTGVLGNKFVMPTPAMVWDAARILIEDGTLQDEAWATLRRVLIAFGLALVVGATLGILIGRIRTVRYLLRPLVQFLFPTPKVAIYPAMLIILGLGSASKIAFGFAEALFPILISSAAAASQIDPRLLWSAEGLGLSRAATFPRVVLPAALPGILTGARIGLVGALIGVFLGEMIAGSDGLGQMMAIAYRTLRTPDMYVVIVTVSLIGFFLDRMFLFARGRLLAWSPEEGR
jgi:ABC-type nitrate/sulfonate/bicarbonate transport system permease component